MRFLLLLPMCLALFACADSRERALSDAGTTVIDSGMRDAGRDAGPPPDLQLGRALSCDLDEDAVVRAAARFVACEERGTMSQLVEAWEAGLWSGLEPSGGLLGIDVVELGCEAWRCIAAADSCDAYASCRAPVAETCEPFARTCFGDRIVTCDAEGTALAPGFDCASVGAVCVDGQCVVGECRFGGDYYQLSCDDTGGLVLCDGARRLDCDAWSPGSRCAPFYIGGEVPTQWCSPSGGGMAGGYERPVECDGRTVRFESAVSGRALTLDCVAAGYAACDDRGCTP